MTNKAKLNEWVSDHGEDSDFVRVRVRGEFPRFGTNQLISSEAVDNARKADIGVDEYVHFNVLIGVDVGRFGSDETVITVRQGRRVHEQRIYRGLNNIQVGARAAEVWRETGSKGVIFVDGIGLGTGVVDYLMTAGYPVIDVVGGEKANDDKRFYNKRAEMWHRMSEWIARGADIPDDSMLCDQMTALEYGYDMRERIKLETKEQLADRMPELGSPDRADSLAMTFAEIIAPGGMEGSFEPEEEEYA